MIPEKIQHLRKDPKNYKWKGCIYSCPEDPYVIVPKHIAWMGWTFNFAHPKVWPMLFYVIFAIEIPILFLIYLTYKNNWSFSVIWIGLAITVALVSFWAHTEATRSP